MKKRDRSAPCFPPSSRARAFTLFRTFPLSGDDWFREGLGASLHSIGDLACVVAEKWRTTNGRILGNILAYSAGSRPILRDLLRALITLCSSRCSRAFQADFHSRTAAVRRGRCSRCRRSARRPLGGGLLQLCSAGGLSALRPRADRRGLCGARRCAERTALPRALRARLRLAAFCRECYPSARSARRD